MWGSKTKVRAALVAVFALVFMSVGLVSASAGQRTTTTIWQPGSIWAESNDCESVTIYFAVQTGDEAVVYPAFNAQGTVNGDVKNGNGDGWTSITFQGVTPGTANWSGSMWWDWSDGDGSGQFSNEGRVQVEPCPVTTTTTPSTTTPATTPTTTPPTTVPGSSSTLAQVETDLPNSGGPALGLIAMLAVAGVSILGGTALIASRREN